MRLKFSDLRFHRQVVSKISHSFSSCCLVGTVRGAFEVQNIDPFLNVLCAVLNQLEIYVVESNEYVLVQEAIVDKLTEDINFS